MNANDFTARVIEIAREKGFPVETNRSDQLQIVFGHKKLHEGHLSKLHPGALQDDADINSLIESVAPGRPCTHKPMREVLNVLRNVS